MDWVLTMRRWWWIGVAGLLVLHPSVVVGQGGMLSFPTANGGVQVPHAPSLLPLAITVEAWAEWSQPIGQGGFILMKSQSATSYALYQTFYGYLQWTVQAVGSANQTVEAPVPAPQHGWHHVAGTYDGATMRLFIDGLQVASLAKTGVLNPNSTGPIVIGQNTYNPGSSTYEGVIDEVRIWSVARTASQIQYTMNRRLDNRPGLIAAWHFDGGFQDLTGGHNGTPLGVVTIVPSTAPIPAVLLQAPPSVPLGGQLVYDLFIIPPMAGYVLDVSLSGTSPGVMVPPPGSGVFPLNPPFMNATYGPQYPGTFVNFVATTDAFGDAHPLINVPIIPFMGPLTISAAFVSLNPSAPLGIGAISNATSTTLTALPPFVTSVTPATSPAAGAWPVTVHGGNFQSGAIVTFGGAPAGNVVVTSPSTITCTTPSGAIGPIPVSVQNPDGNVATLSTGFSYVATLVIASASPVVAAAGAGVTISGGGFQPGLTAAISGIPASASQITPGAFTVSVPSGVPCSAILQVTNPDGQTASTPFNPSPLITGLINSTGPSSGGGTLLILGNAFHPGTTVKIGGISAPIASQIQTALIVTVPAGIPGPASIAVRSLTNCTAMGTYVYL